MIKCKYCGQLVRKRNLITHLENNHFAFPQPEERGYYLKCGVCVCCVPHEEVLSMVDHCIKTGHPAKQLTMDWSEYILGRTEQMRNVVGAGIVIMTKRLQQIPSQPLEFPLDQFNNGQYERRNAKKITKNTKSRRNRIENLEISQISTQFPPEPMSNKDFDETAIFAENMQSGPNISRRSAEPLNSTAIFEGGERTIFKKPEPRKSVVDTVLNSTIHSPSLPLRSSSPAQTTKTTDRPSKQPLTAPIFKTPSADKGPLKKSKAKRIKIKITPEPEKPKPVEPVPEKPHIPEPDILDELLSMTEIEPDYDLHASTLNKSLTLEEVKGRNPETIPLARIALTDNLKDFQESLKTLESIEQEKNQTITELLNETSAKESLNETGLSIKSNMEIAQLCSKEVASMRNSVKCREAMQRLRKHNPRKASIQNLAYKGPELQCTLCDYVAIGRCLSGSKIYAFAHGMTHSKTFLFQCVDCGVRKPNHQEMMTHLKRKLTTCQSFIDIGTPEKLDKLRQDLNDAFPTVDWKQCTAPGTSYRGINF